MVILDHQIDHRGNWNHGFYSPVSLWFSQLISNLCSNYGDTREIQGSRQYPSICFVILMPMNWSTIQVKSHRIIAWSPDHPCISHRARKYSQRRKWHNKVSCSPSGYFRPLRLLGPEKSLRKHTKHFIDSKGALRISGTSLWHWIISLIIRSYLKSAQSLLREKVNDFRWNLLGQLKSAAENYSILPIVWISFHVHILDPREP